MKARITTVLSLTGVLVAGSAAALVNTQVLQNSSTSTAAAAEITVENQTESVSTVSTTPTSVSLPNKLESVAGVAVTLATTPVSTQQQYAIGESGTVVLDTANGALTIVGIYPNAGWGVLEHENTDPQSVEIKFQSATTLVEFKANVLMGVVAWDTESFLLPQGSTGNTVGQSGTSPTVGTSGTSGTTGTTGSSGGHTTTSVEDNDDSGHHGGGGNDD